MIKGFIIEVSIFENLGFAYSNDKWVYNEWIIK